MVWTLAPAAGTFTTPVVFSMISTSATSENGAFEGVARSRLHGLDEGVEVCGRWLGLDGLAGYLPQLLVDGRIPDEPDLLRGPSHERPTAIYHHLVGLALECGG